MNKKDNDWQKLFSEMMEESIQYSSFHAVSKVVINHALKLGFSRAHLFWVPTREDINNHNLMVGITCAGKDCIPGFPRSFLGTSLYPVSEWFDLNETKQSRDAIFLHLDQADEIQRQAEAFGYQWPVSEVVFLPLWGSNGLLGGLLLDHWQQKTVLSERERSLMNLFTRQVSVVLENAGSISRERRSVQEMATASHIGHQIMTKAAEETDLSILLEDVREQMDLLMDVSDFAFFLLDPESIELDMRLLYERGVRCRGLPDPSKLGIEKFLLARRASTIFWPVDVHENLRKNRIKLKGEIPNSCIGVQLYVGEKIIGGITVKRFERDEQFTRRDYMLLSSVGKQLSGAIELLHAREVEKRDAARMNVLRRAMMEMLGIAKENMDDLWLTALTFATASFGTGFNRALLFLENEDHTQLVGKTGIGTKDPERARRDWEYDAKRDYQFNNFFAELKQKKINFTDLHFITRKIEFQPTHADSIINQVFRGGHRKIVEEDRIEEWLPREITNKVSLAACAILPILSGNRTIGIVIVDNKHHATPLSEKKLDQLQTLLNYTGLVWESLLQQNKIESLLDANYLIMGEARLQSLKDTLRKICVTAQNFTEADWVLIYPLKEGKKYEFDRANATYIGNLKLLDDVIKEKPSSDGISSYILRTGELVVSDTENTDIVIGDVHISEHNFIKRERVKAVVGISIHDAQKDEPLGILYLDYRSPQDISDLDVHHAKSFASLAAVAISNARRFDEIRHRKRLEAAQEIAEAIGAELDLPRMFQKVLGRLQGFFEHTSLFILTYDENENALKFAPSTLEFYKIQNPKFKGQHTFPLSGKSLACQVARNALKTKNTGALNIANLEASEEYLNLNPQTRSELCVPLIDGQRKLLGVLVLERTKLHGFDEDDIALVETVAGQLSMAMERTQNSEQLSFKTTVAALTSWAADIAHDINNEAEEIKGYTYLIKELAQENEQLVNYASKIEDSAQRLFDAGPKSKQGKQAISLDQAIKKFAEPLAHQRDIQIEFLLGANENHIFVNPTDFRRILQHLTRNADRAMQGLEKKKITILTRRAENNEVEILFRDHGPGVPENVQLSILQKSVTTKQSGGFGLLLTRQFVEDMGGTIRLVPSPTDEGATFSIKLPTTNFFDEVNIE